MCLIVFALNHNPNYKFIFAANRDEFYNRPASPAKFWDVYPNLLAGKDLKEGGTWMGVTKQGSFAAITNYRDLHNLKLNAPTRGNLVKDFLINDSSIESFSNNLISNGKNYNGFNLLFGNFDNLFFFSNYWNAIQKIENGIHGLSNHLLDTNWFKVVKSKNIFEQTIKKENFSSEDIFEILSDTSLSPDDELPDTGLDYEKEKMISSIFIKTPEYGTRCSTVITVDKNNFVNFNERTFSQSSENYSEAKFQFQIE